MEVNKSIFRENDIRGIYPEQLNEFTISKIAKAIAVKCKKENIKIILEGDTILFNQYGVILVNPVLHKHVKQESAQMFIDWLISKEGQYLISSFVPNKVQLFFPKLHSQLVNKFLQGIR